MKQSEFLRLLDLHLGDIIQSEKKDIFDDYREHFKIAISQGKTEEEICSSLGDPKEIARQYMDYSVNQVDGKVYRRNIIGETISSLGICCLNLFGLGKNYIDEQRSIAINDIKNIKIKSTIENINLIPTDSPDLKVSISGYCNSKNENRKPKLMLIKAGDTLDIKIYRKIRIGINLRIEKIKIDICIPKSYDSNIFVNANLGDTKIENISSNYLSFYTSIGNVTIDSSNINNLICKANAGDAKINGVYNYFEYEGTVGSLTCKNIISKETVLNNSAGKMVLKGNPGNVKSTSKIGDLLLEYNEYDSNITSISKTGDIKIKLPDSAQFHLSCKSKTGTVKCKFPVMAIIDGRNNTNIVGNRIEGTVVSDKNEIKVNSSIGDIRIGSIND